MFRQIKLQHFKRFRDQQFDVSDNIVLAGPNNSGKTTLLQAVAIWNLALRKWLAERGPVESKSRKRSLAKERTGVAITRKDFTAIPLREMNLLWTDCSTALSREEISKGQAPGAPRILKIEVSGNGKNGGWTLSFEFRYGNSELIYVKPAKDTPIEAILDTVKNLQVVHVPPFSGIGAEETHYDRAYQDLLIGQGKPGDILRNLLLDVHNSTEKWQKLCTDIEEIFGYRILPPSYEGRPFIVCEYQQQTKSRRLDIASAGSGFLQVLMLLGFFYARPASILLLDEPDAHLHVVLQKQVYDRLREVALRSGCQLLIATHSEVLIDSTSPEKIISFLKEPHRLISETEQDQVREALKRLTSLDLLMAEQAPGVLYVEGESDLDLLREWARVLGHRAYTFLAKPFWHNNQGRNPREARAHFFSLKAVDPGMKGVLILDGDNRNLEDHELTAEGLTILRWKRYEVENYLIHPASLARFVEGATPDLFSAASAQEGMNYFRNELPPAVLANPLYEHDYLEVTPASKTLLPGFLQAAGISLTKNEYFQLAAQMLPNEIPQEISQKLEVIADAFGIKLPDSP